MPRHLLTFPSVTLQAAECVSAGRSVNRGGFGAVYSRRKMRDRKAPRPARCYALLRAATRSSATMDVVFLCERQTPECDGDGASPGAQQCVCVFLRVCA